MSGELTTLLQAVNRGDQAALNRVIALLYMELRQLAHRCHAGERNISLGTTDMVHECYLRLLNSRQLNINDRAHFFNTAARVMRHLLCDYARDRLAYKRQGEGRQETLREDDAAERFDAERWLAVDQALDRLAQFRPWQARVVECRFFSGLSEEETAEALDRSLRSVQRDWAAAREWLTGHLAK